LASHGGLVLEFLENKSIYCIIVDLKVAHVSGLEIIDLLQRNIRRPWIIATCHEENPNRDYLWLELATLVGADEVIAKPYCLEQLLDRFPASFFEAQKKGTEIPARSEQSDRNLLQQSVTH
jgi:DNA-binding response OmpR family regulator